MTAQRDPYVRVYYRIIDDPKFESVFEDDRSLATWLRLLLTADATYPAPAPLPDGVHRVTLGRLSEAGLIDLLPNRRYRMHGLAAERERRSEHGRQAAQARYGSNAPAVREQSASSAGASDRAMHSEPLRSAPIQSAPLRTAPTPAGAEKHGSKNLETDEERMARYLALRDDPSKSADIRYAAENEVKRLEALRLN